MGTVGTRWVNNTSLFSLALFFSCTITMPSTAVGNPLYLYSHVPSSSATNTALLLTTVKYGDYMGARWEKILHFLDIIIYFSSTIIVASTFVGNPLVLSSQALASATAITTLLLAATKNVDYVEASWETWASLFGGIVFNQIVQHHRAWFVFHIPRHHLAPPPLLCHC
jgi:hypothetical protein